MYICVGLPKMTFARFFCKEIEDIQFIGTYAGRIIRLGAYGFIFLSVFQIFFYSFLSRNWSTKSTTTDPASSPIKVEKFQLNQNLNDVYQSKIQKGHILHSFLNGKALLFLRHILKAPNFQFNSAKEAVHK